jgi:hypothetical protein
MQTGPYIRGSLRLSSDERRQAIIEGKVPKHTLIHETVSFALRRVALREEPIKRHYNSRFTCKVDK